MSYRQTLPQLMPIGVCGGQGQEALAEGWEVAVLNLLGI